jgi:hypothetical protein
MVRMRGRALPLVALVISLGVLGAAAVPNRYVCADDAVMRVQYAHRTQEPSYGCWPRVLSGPYHPMDARVDHQLPLRVGLVAVGLLVGVGAVLLMTRRQRPGMSPPGLR